MTKKPASDGWDAVDLRHFETIASLMDHGVRIPRTRLRVPLDPVLGLIPGVGDFAPFVLSLGLIARARQLGVPNAKIRRMLINSGLDAALGTIPLVGDVFDFFFKAQRRNLKIVRDHVATRRLSDRVEP
jgi:hypothetical protein